MIFLDLFDRTFLGLGLGKLFPARESLVSGIPAGDWKIAKPFLQCTNAHCAMSEKSMMDHAVG